MEKKNNKGEQKKSVKKAGKKTNKSSENTPTKVHEKLRPAPKSILSTFRTATDSCLRSFRVAIGEAELTLAAAYERRLNPEEISAVKSFKSFFEVESRHIADDTADWELFEHEVNEKYLSISPEAVENMPSEDMEFALQIRDRESDFYDDLHIAYLYLLVRESQAILYSRILYDVRWRGQKMMPNLIKFSREASAAADEFPKVLDMRAFLRKKGRIKT